jgi:hypothetical protein
MCDGAPIGACTCRRTLTLAAAQGEYVLTTNVNTEGKPVMCIQCTFIL